MSELTQEDFEAAINALSESFTSDVRKSDLCQALVKNPDMFKDVDRFYYTHLSQRESAIMEAIAIVKQLPSNVKYKYTSVFLDYQFYKCNISKATEMLEGSGCSVDRARTIIRAYLNYLQTGNEPDWTANNYWIPKQGSWQQWHELMSALHDMRYGVNQNYLKAWHALFKLHLENLNK